MAVGFLKRNPRVFTPDVVQQKVAVFADERLFVVAGNIVPFDTILVDVVEDAHARFGGAVDVELGVIGLRTAGVALVAPGLVAPVGRRPVGGGHLGVGVGPEPAKDANGLQILALVATLEVTQASRCPDVAEVTWASQGSQS